MFIGGVKAPFKKTKSPNSPTYNMINIINKVKFKIALLLLLVGMISFTGIGQTTPYLVQNSTEVVQDHQAVSVNAVSVHTVKAIDGDLSIFTSNNLERYKPHRANPVLKEDLIATIDINTRTEVPNINKLYDQPQPNIKSKSRYEILPEKNFKNPRDGLNYVVN